MDNSSQILKNWLRLAKKNNNKIINKTQKLGKLKLIIMSNNEIFMDKNSGKLSFIGVPGIL